MRHVAVLVEKKAVELPRYKKECGLEVRLLVVANRIHNSGKFCVETRGALDTKGFQTGYFFPYPEAVVVFD
jgi:hypothetical protein